MSCICSAGGDYDENRICLAPITVVATATATNTATGGSLLELQEYSDPALTDYWA